ncbi:MAG: glutaredoxin family protein [Methanocellales archaeon]|nr:glutaredoxin family protein [Methanocellales archaeon]MDI6903032.1 glutaredoxin family protein [Methanocellales archaeon]
MPAVKVYTTKTCPKCEQLKRSLEFHEVAYEEVDMTTPEALTELRMSGIFTTSAPVLQIDDAFFTSSDLSNEVKLNQVLELLRKGKSHA